MERVPELQSIATHDDVFQQASAAIVSAGLRIYQRGWAPATSGNFSHRLDAFHCAITVSGVDKSQLCPQDIVRVNLDGDPLEDKKPSAETELHTSLYLRDASIKAVLHTHSRTAVLVSRAAMRAGEAVVLEGFELLKAFSGINSHSSCLRIPVFKNSQNITSISHQVMETMNKFGTGHAYLIEGHGIYTWGRSMEDAMRHLEALEYLLEVIWCERYKP